MSPDSCSTHSAPALGMALLSCAAMWLTGGTSSAADGEWTRRNGDAWGTRRGATANISSRPGDEPSVSWSVRARSRSLAPMYLGPLGVDGVLSAFVPVRGRVVAYSVWDGATEWVSSPHGIDRVLGLVDLDGDGNSTDLVASSSQVGGGVFVFDAASGALTSSVDGLAERSGVDPGEATFADLDADGRPELLFPSSIYNVDDLFWISWSEGLGAPSVVTATFPGYNNLTPLSAGPFLDEATETLVLHQGHHYTLWSTCDAADPEAQCAADGSAPCLCRGKTLLSIHPNYAFGPSWAVDTDGDGVSELLHVANDPSLLRAVALLDLRAGNEVDADFGGATRRWSVNQNPDADGSVISAPAPSPSDLDGDGDLDLLLSFYDNDGDELDGAGAPVDDGIDAPLSWSWAVIDLATGAPVYVEVDAMALGIADVDGDDVPEVVSAPTAGITVLEGLSGTEVLCSGGPCQGEQVWSSPDHRAVLDLASLAVLAPPRSTIGVIDAEEDGDDEILAWIDGAAELIDFDATGQVLSLGVLPMGPEGRIHQATNPYGVVVVSDGATYGIVVPSFGVVGTAREVPPSGLARWGAARADESASGAHVFIDGTLFDAGPESGGIPIAVADFLPRFGLAQDLDGDGVTEWLSFSTAADGLGDGAVLRLDQRDPGGAWSPRWEFAFEDDEGLALATFAGEVPFVTGSFGGGTSLDIAAAVRTTGGPAVAFWDGETGVLLAVSEGTVAPGNHSPLLAVDLVSAEGAPGADGIDEVVVGGVYSMEAHTASVGATIWSVPTAHPHVVAAWLEGVAGPPSLVSTTSVNINNRLDRVSVSAESATTDWGPVTLGRPSGAMDVLSFIEADGVPPLEIVYANGDGAIELRDATDGELWPGYPLHLSAEGVVSEADPSAPVPRAVVVLDVDNDGFEEVVLGRADGSLLAITVAPADGDARIGWTFQLGAAVEALGAADVDGDGYDELLVSTADGRALAVDGLGARLEITSPVATACIPRRTSAVFGTSVGIDRVRVSAGGEGSEVGVAADGSWVADVEIDGAGAHEILAEGLFENGDVAVVATRLVHYEGDGDGDGVAPCGGDCDDTDFERAAGLSDTCEDGFDQDCDGVDADCPPNPTPESTPEQGPEATPEPQSVGGCPDCALGGRSSLWTPSLTLLFLISRRRKTR